MPVLFGGHNLSPLVEIGLTDLPKSGGAMAPPAPPGTTGLLMYIEHTNAQVICHSDREAGEKNCFFDAFFACSWTLTFVEAWGEN